VARALGRRLLVEAPADEEARIQRGFRLCFSRTPDAFERDHLRAYLAAQQDAFAEDPEDAGELAGEDFPEHVSPAEAAAWVALARVLINLDEFITRE
jgi:hypothetical protein